MDPITLALIIAFGGGLVIGIAVGGIAASKITARLLVRKERDTWIAANRYYQRKARAAA
jgi:hypothetical protein